MAVQHNPDQYSELCLKVAKKLSMNASQTWIYQNSHLAVFDATSSLQQFLIHKPQIAVVKKGSSLVDAMMPIWLRNQISIVSKADQQTWPEFIESLPKDISFVLWASENEITGEVIVSDSEAAEIHKRLSEKRIFSVQIQDISRELKPLDKYSIIIKSNFLFGSPLTLVLLPERMKAKSISSGFQDIQFLNQLVESFESELYPVKQGQLLEKNFSDSKNFYFNYFTTSSERLQDRLVFWLQSLTGSAVKEYLKLSDQVSFAPSQIPFWNLQSWSNWWKEAESEKLLRGLLIVSKNYVEKNASFTNEFETAIHNLKEMSSWVSDSSK